MPVTRTVTVATTQANAIDFCHLVRIDLPAPVGTYRFTDRASDVTADVSDGAGSQTWTSSTLQLLNVDQSSTDILAPSAISFANIDYTWTNWVMTLAGAGKSLRGAQCSVYRYWYTVPDSGYLLNEDGTSYLLTESGDRIQLDDAPYYGFLYPLYLGTVDNHSLGTQAQLALAPFGTPWGRDTPWMTLPMIDPVFGKLMPDRTQIIYWQGQVTPAQGGIPPGTGGSTSGSSGQNGYLGFTGGSTPRTFRPGGK